MAPSRKRPSMLLAAALAVAIVAVSGTRAVATAGTAGSPSGSAGAYAWPVVGPVIRGFEPPPDPYQAGHRGIDIGTAFGTPVLAAQDGTVSFAGWVAGALFVSIDHPDGYRSTYSWLSAVLVPRGAPGDPGRTDRRRAGTATPRSPPRTCTSGSGWARSIWIRCCSSSPATWRA